MSQVEALAPVRKSITVEAPQARAFEVFTAGMGRWWPRTHVLNPSTLLGIVIEPFPGGRWYSRHEDGSEPVTGHVLAWDPHDRVLFSWEIGAAWKPDAAVASEVEVRFIPEGETRTRVELEHRKFEVLGAESGAKMRRDVDGGWPSVLAAFAGEIAK